VAGGYQQYGMGIHAGNPSDLGTCAVRRAWLLDWFGRLRDRFRNVRVCCGNWSRVITSESVTTRLGTTGVFLDPPYAHNLDRLAAWRLYLAGEGPAPGKRKGGASNRAEGLYATDHADVDRLVASVHLWALEAGSDARMRIALAGYEGEHDALEECGWHVEHWHAQGGYGNRSKRGKQNARRERLWFSPHCVFARGLFDAA
jgi:DNA adenine methylase